MYTQNIEVVTYQYYDSKFFSWRCISGAVNHNLQHKMDNEPLQMTANDTAIPFLMPFLHFYLSK